jgi:hypothetical protein
MTGPNVYKVDFHFKALGTGTADLIFAITTGKGGESDGVRVSDGNTPKDAALYKQEILGVWLKLFLYPMHPCASFSLLFSFFFFLRRKSHSLTVRPAGAHLHRDVDGCVADGRRGRRLPGPGG